MLEILARRPAAVEARRKEERWAMAKCAKCGDSMWFKRDDDARHKVIRVCKNSACSMKDFEVSYSA